MKARIFCTDAPHFPPHGHHGHHGNSTHSASSAIPSPSGAPEAHHHHKQWQHCEIVPEGHFDGPLVKKDIFGAAFFGFVCGLLLCAIPLFVLLRKVRRMKKMGKRGGPHIHGGRHGPGGGGRWRFQQHGPPPPPGFPEYETEHLLKPEYEAPTDY